MIQGVVNSALEAIVSLTLKGPSGRTREIEAVVDTGFSELLTLTPALTAELRLDFAGVDYLALADGSIQKFDVFTVTLFWDGRPRHVQVLASDAIPLVGMGLMEGHRLVVNVEEGGRVFIESQG